VRAGLKAIYCSGWQVAGDANSAGDVYPDQSLYPANSVPEVVRKINKVQSRLRRVQAVRSALRCLVGFLSKRRNAAHRSVWKRFGNLAHWTTLDLLTAHHVRSAG